jgi:L-ascorbate metabolism protein UlaG (beta-lactamase superfamily)
MLRVDYLNHASVLLHLGPVRLLSDPWYWGDCFSGGWGLRYDNPEALDRAATATHLWISHWHSDHLHGPTLQALAARNPDIEVLANVSANFSMLERLRGLGFRKLRALGERRPLELEAGVTVTRHPTAGIDNALHVTAPGWSILNYNDCNLPAGAVRSLARRLGGPLDLLLNNYNHAGKLFSRDSLQREKDGLWQKLARSAELFAPRHLIPFASSHYYRAAVSRDQNGSLLSFDDLAARAGGDPRFSVLRVGDSVRFTTGAAAGELERREPALRILPEDELDYGPSLGWDELLKAAAGRCEQIRRGFPGVARLLGPLRIEVYDLGRVLEVETGRGGREAVGAAPHIAMHSVAVHQWFGKRFGDDTFTAGAHFAIRDSNTRRIRNWALLGLLEASHLSLRDALGYLRSREGLWFLWCRREEALATVLSGQLKAGQVRLD